jgi:hypothetical protein
MHKNVMLMDEYAHREAMDKMWGRDDHQRMNSK